MPVKFWVYSKITLGTFIVFTFLTVGLIFQQGAAVLTRLCTKYSCSISPKHAKYEALYVCVNHWRTHTKCWMTKLGLWCSEFGVFYQKGCTFALSLSPPLPPVTSSLPFPPSVVEFVLCCVPPTPRYTATL